MSIEFSVKVKGMKELEMGMKNLRENMVRAARVALPEIGFILEANSRDMCPVDTGSLRSAIGHFDESYLVKELRPEVSPEDAVFTITSDRVFVGTNVPYAVKVHERDPWFESALRQSIGDITEVFRQAAGEGLMRSFGKNLMQRARLVMSSIRARSRRRGR